MELAASEATPEIFADGLTFPECPRWHEGRLHLSDMWGRRVVRFDAVGTAETLVALDDDPGGLGWLPDGDLLVVGMGGKKVWRLPAAVAAAGGAGQGDLEEYADLAALSPYELNDMWVGPDGTAWVTQFGSDWLNGQIEPCALIRVTTDGTVSAAADGMMIPNGIVVDGDSLLVAEPGAMRLSRFTINGTELRDRVEIPLTPGEGAAFVAPDGICVDERPGAGHWVADPMNHRVFRIVDGQTVEDVATPGLHATAVLVADRALWITGAEEISKAHRTLGDTGKVLRVQLR